MSREPKPIAPKLIASSVLASLSELVGLHLVERGLFQSTAPISGLRLAFIANDLLNALRGERPDTFSLAAEARIAYKSWKGAALTPAEQRYDDYKGVKQLDVLGEVVNGLGLSFLAQSSWSALNSLATAAGKGMWSHVPAILGSAAASIAAPMLLPKAIESVLSRTNLTDEQKAIVAPWLKAIGRVALATAPRVNADEHGVHYQYPTTDAAGTHEHFTGGWKLDSIKHLSEDGMVVVLTDDANNATDVRFTHDGENVVVTSSEPSVTEQLQSYFDAARAQLPSASSVVGTVASVAEKALPIVTALHPATPVAARVLIAGITAVSVHGRGVSFAAAQEAAGEAIYMKSIAGGAFNAVVSVPGGGAAFGGTTSDNKGLLVLADADSNVVWTKAIGGSQHNINGVCLTPDQTVVFAGQSRGGFSGGYGGWDISVGEVTLSGQPVNALLSGGSANDHGNGIACGLSGEVYIVGDTRSTQLGAAGGGLNAIIGRLNRNTWSWDWFQSVGESGKTNSAMSVVINGSNVAYLMRTDGFSADTQDLLPAAVTQSFGAHVNAVRINGAGGAEEPGQIVARADGSVCFVATTTSFGADSKDGLFVCGNDDQFQSAFLVRDAGRQSYTAVKLSGTDVVIGGNTDQAVGWDQQLVVVDANAQLVSGTRVQSTGTNVLNRFSREGHFAGKFKTTEASLARIDNANGLAGCDVTLVAVTPEVKTLTLGEGEWLEAVAAVNAAAQSVTPPVQLIDANDVPVAEHGGAVTEQCYQAGSGSSSSTTGAVAPTTVAPTTQPTPAPTTVPVTTAAPTPSTQAPTTQPTPAPTTAAATTEGVVPTNPPTEGPTEQSSAGTESGEVESSTAIVTGSYGGGTSGYGSGTGMSWSDSTSESEPQSSQSATTGGAGQQVHGGGSFLSKNGRMFALAGTSAGLLVLIAALTGVGVKLYRRRASDRRALADSYYLEEQSQRLLSSGGGSERPSFPASHPIKGAQILQAHRDLTTGKLGGSQANAFQLLLNLLLAAFHQAWEETNERLGSDDIADIQGGLAQVDFIFDSNATHGVRARLGSVDQVGLDDAQAVADVYSRINWLALQLLYGESEAAARQREVLIDGSGSLVRLGGLKAAVNHLKTNASFANDLNQLFSGFIPTAQQSTSNRPRTSGQGAYSLYGKTPASAAANPTASGRASTESGQRSSADIFAESERGREEAARRDARQYAGQQSGRDRTPEFTV